MKLTVEDIKKIIADVAETLVETAVRDSPDVRFGDFDDYVTETVAKNHPLIIKSIEDDEAELARLQAMTENLIDLGEFVVAVVERAIKYAAPLIAAL